VVHSTHSGVLAVKTVKMWGLWEDEDGPVERSLTSYRYWTSKASNHSVNGTWQWDDAIGDDFAANLTPASDVSVDAVVLALYLNSFAFVFLMASYEVLRRLLPAVYSSKIKKQFKTGMSTYDGSDGSDDALDGQAPVPDPRASYAQTQTHARTASVTSIDSIDGSLPDVVSFNWVLSVFNVPWSTVRKSAGLDGYFFLRFIRMNLRICGVTFFWAFMILVPVYATGAEQNGEHGWYHFSVANVSRGSWRMWVPTVFAYLFTGFIFFVMKQEYRHFLELRMDFLARGSSHVHPQHHFSLLVENIPFALRSDKALFDYFDKLFPGKVHSASVVLNLPDLEAVKARCLRVCRRLEKSIAHYYAAGNRPTHNAGSPRINILGIDLTPFDWSCGAYPE
jgi:hypothetical protein